jgi:hypothetical protein
LNDVDIISNQFIHDLEALCSLKETMNRWGKKEGIKLKLFFDELTAPLLLF